jgi:3-phosphoshikimate 1-carboxyvinyltransferase
MDQVLSTAMRIVGRLQVPGDKSISHRLALLGALAEGYTTIANFATSQDCHSTLSCLRSLGTFIEVKDEKHVSILGKGLRGLTQSDSVLDAGNSGSTIRMLSGILAGQSFLTRISGDASLVRRPMKRVITPLTLMGARIEAREGNFPPLAIQGGQLRALSYTLPIASAQVKSAILFAGLYAEGTTEIIEPFPTRNHSELALREFGADVKVENNKISVRGLQPLKGIRCEVPGDLSSAAFFVVAASMLPKSELTIEAVGLNPGRRAIIDWLKNSGADIEILDLSRHEGEPVGSLRVRASQIRGGRIDGALIPKVIDEVPILAVLATQSLVGLEIRDAGELRVKESDRIRTVVDNLRAMGATVEEYPDGMFVPGGQNLRGALIRPNGDHRVAMAFSIAALIAKGKTCIENADCAAVSFPDFHKALQRLVVR